jgi:hypothetical protein
MQMIAQAIQQSDTYLATLQAMGVVAWRDETTDTVLLRRGPVTLASRCGTNLPTQRGICVVNPDTSGRFQRTRFYQIMTAATVAELDLTTPMTPHQKWRNTLRKAQHGPLRVQHRPFDPVRDAWFLSANIAHQKQRKYKGMPHDVAVKWPTRDARMAIAFLRGTPVAAMLFLCHDVTVTYQIGWSGDVGRKHAAHHLLLYEAAERFANRGYARLDFGTVDSVNAPGLAQFKYRAGANFRALGGTWITLPKWRS